MNMLAKLLNVFKFTGIKDILPTLDIPRKQRFQGHSSGGTHYGQWHNNKVARNRRRNRIASMSRRINRMRMA